MRLARIAARFLAAHLKTWVEYRFGFVMGMFTNVFMYSLTYAGIWILLDRFETIQGWSLYEVMLLFNLNMVSYGVASFFFREPMEALGGRLVGQGDFDSVLSKPMNPFLYLVLRHFQPPYFGHMILGSIVFGICFANLSIAWSAAKVIFLILAVVGGILIQASFYVSLGTLSFWTTRNTMIGLVVHGVRDFISYPISIYGRIIQVLLTFAIPYAFVNFYPAQYFLDRQGPNLFHPILQFGTPVVGAALFLLAYRFWTIGVNRYESTGS